MGSWYIFDLGQSCACEACAESADATGNLRGKQEPETAPAAIPDAAHTKDAESAETGVKLKSLSAPVPQSNEDKWEGASVRGSNMLYCSLSVLSKICCRF